MKVLEMERPMMDSWNDDRLDELSNRVDDGFKEMNEGFKRADERFATKEEMNRRFDEVDRRFDEVDKKFDKVDRKFEEVLFQLGRVNDRLDGYARVAFVTGVGLFGAVVVAILGLVLQA
jgi:hypothetical protein